MSETFRLPDQYMTSPPSRQNMIDIFAGAWTSGLPGGLRSGGRIPLFADPRMRWFLDRITVAGRTVAELGPFEGGHSYALHEAGASIAAIEANTLAILKMLVVKEVYGLDRLHLFCGEIEAWLNDHAWFDVILASGVLYHFKRPLLALYNMAQRADSLCIWTHFIDENACGLDDPRMAPLTGVVVRENVRGYEADGFVRSYEGNEANATFCGGVGAMSVWLRKTDIIGALTQWGFDVELGMDEPGHANGPAAAFVARRRGMEVADV